MARANLILFLTFKILSCYLFGNSVANYFEESFIHRLPEPPARNALIIDSYLWPNGIVPYIISDEFSNREKQTIARSMNQISEKTCIQFIEKNEEHVEHVKFVKDKERCDALVGFRENRSDPMVVTYSGWCVKKPGAVKHEMFHVLGLFHEHSRPDRDDYIEILWDNIDPVYYPNFYKTDYIFSSAFGLPYDYDSLMHYPSNAFAKKGKNVTIVSKDGRNQILGQLEEPTYFDYEKIRRMYKCKGIYN